MAEEGGVRAEEGGVRVETGDMLAEEGDVRVADAVGRFPGRVFGLPHEAPTGMAAGPSWPQDGVVDGWGWLRRDGGEAGAGSEEAEDEAAAGAEDVLWLGRRAGVFLPWTVRLG